MGGFNLSLFGTPPTIPGVPSGTPTGTPPWWPTSRQPTAPSSGGGWWNNGTFQNILQAVGLGTGVLGSILNRPKGLSKEQQRAFDMLLAQLQSEATKPATVDPAMRAQLLNQVAGSLRGAQNRIENNFASRGLGNSGLRISEQGRASRTAEGAQIAGEVDLLNQAKSQQNQKIAQLQSLLMGAPSLQGASAAGVGLSSLSNALGYLLTLNQLGRSTNRSGGNSGGLTQSQMNAILQSISGGFPL